MSAGGGSIRIIACTTVLFPLPDSPTRPKISPELISNETLCTASTDLMSVIYSTDRFFTEIIGLFILTRYRSYSLVN